MLPSDRRSGRVEVGQHPVDRMVAERPDVPPRELGRQALAVPVGEQPDHDDRLLDPRRQSSGSRTAGAIAERRDATLRMPPAPAMEARPAGAQGEGRLDAGLTCRTYAAHPEAERCDVLASGGCGRPAAARGEEQEAGPFLIGVPLQASVLIRTIVGVGAVYRATLVLHAAMGWIVQIDRRIVAGMPAHPAPPLAVSESEVEVLRAMIRAGTTEQRLALRARIILRAAEGVPNVRVADELGVSVPTVILWRQRFKERGLDGLDDAPHPGRPRTYGREVRERILAETLTPPEGMTHWSRERMAERVGVSASTVGRVWHEGQLKPHRVETFKYSRDPELVAKVTDVVGLYLAPPERAIVLSVDEKTQIQALDRTQPMLPLRPGQVERHTHDYKRHGTTSLFAALEVGTGRVTTDTRERHTGADFLAFLRLIAREYPRGEVHVVLDNVSTHKTPDVQTWLAGHRRFRFHFTPTSASWMNQVETWFGILTRQAIRRGSFESVRSLVAAIERFTREWNAGASPFTWVKTADQILARAVRKTQADSGAGH